MCFLYGGFYPEYLSNLNLSHQAWLIVLLCFIRSWILYEKPNFEGHSIPLEEGELELAGLWGIDDILERKEEEDSAKPVVIGSIRHVVQVGYGKTRIHLFIQQILIECQGWVLLWEKSSFYGINGWEYLIGVYGYTFYKYLYTLNELEKTGLFHLA